jgi:hypothetical protein
MANFGIRFSHLCDTAVIAQDGRLSIINIFENINTMQLPAIHPQMCVVGSLYYKGEKKDIPESCDVEIDIISPKATKIFSTSQNLPVSEADFGFVFLIQGLQVNEHGQHDVVIKTDGKKIESINLNVILNR